MTVDLVMKIGYIIGTVLGIISLVMSFILWVKNRANAKTDEEKIKVDEILQKNIAVALQNIKANLQEQNLKCNIKEIKTTFKNEIKKES